MLNNCTLEKRFYKALVAQKEYELVWSESRSGFNLCEDELKQLDSVEGIKGGSVLLTIHFVLPKLQLAFLRDANDSKKRITSLGAIEQWDAQRSIGNLTAKKMMDRAIELAADHGIGLVALRNANHWMRGGSYGWQAAEKGYIGICWTNSIAVMPPWGAKECRIGTNPLIVAIPSTPITMVDMSMSMFSYGMLEVNRLAGRQLPVDGGFDDEGNLTKEPGVIEKNRRILPMGYWKGSGMSIVLDMIATLLSDGASVAEVTQDNSDEYGISQIFIAIEVDKLIDGPTRDAKLQRIMDYVTSAERADENQAIRLPGHEFTTLLAENRRNGITVDDSVWAKIQAL